jgi:hypothetical protein
MDAEVENALRSALRRIDELEAKVRELQTGVRPAPAQHIEYVPFGEYHDRGGQGLPPGRTCRITDQGTSDHSFEEVQWVVGSGWTALSGGWSGTKNSATGARELNGRTGIPTGTIVWMRQEVTSTGTVQYAFDITQGDETGGTALDLTGAAGTWDVESQEGPPAKRGLALDPLTAWTMATADDITEPEGLASGLQAIGWASRIMTVDANGNMVAVAAESASADYVTDRRVYADDADGFSDVLFRQDIEDADGKIWAGDGSCLVIATDFRLGSFFYRRARIMHDYMDADAGEALTINIAIGSVPGDITITLERDIFHHLKGASGVYYPCCP